MSTTTLYAIKGSTTEQVAPLHMFLMHLAPGAIITAVFVVLARITASEGWPASLALLMTWVIAGIPILWGILLYQGYRLNGAFSLEGILQNRQPLPFRQYAWIVPVLLVWAAASSTLLFSLGDALRQALFSWWPGWLNLSTFALNPLGYSRPVQWAIVALSAVLNVAVPITEELYFRSYLLPRLPLGKAWAPLWSAILFSLYHFWLPWDFFGRIVTLLPVVYFVQRKQNVYLSIFVHCLLNTLGTLGLLMIVASQGGKPF